MSANGDTYRDFDDISGVDWDSFDEIVLDGPAYQFALLIYSKPKLISDQPRGTVLPQFFPRRLVVRVADQTSDDAMAKVEAAAGDALNPLGWHRTPI